MPTTSRSSAVSRRAASAVCSATKPVSAAGRAGDRRREVGDEADVALEGGERLAGALAGRTAVVWIVNMVRQRAPAAVARSIPCEGIDRAPAADV